jgi:hypothetical protein
MTTNDGDKVQTMLLTPNGLSTDEIMALTPR